MKYLILIAVLLCCVSCGTDPLGEENKQDPANVEINGDHNQVNIDNQGPATNEQQNNLEAEEDETANQDAVDCCLARGNSLNEDDEWSDEGDCYKEASTYLPLGCECVLDGEIRENCGDEEL